jgi:tetratricopeptide (TPR) repeat protein
MADPVTALEHKLLAMSKLTSDYRSLLRVISEEEKKAPGEHMIHVLKGWALSNLGEYDKAEESFKKALQLNPRSAWAQYRRGEMLQRKGRHRDALECFDRAVYIKPRRADFWLAKAAAEDELAMVPEAFNSYRKAVLSGDKSGRGLFGKARILAYMNRLDEALDAVRSAIKLNADDMEYPELEQYILDKLSGY